MDFFLLKCWGNVLLLCYILLKFYNMLFLCVVSMSFYHTFLIANSEEWFKNNGKFLDTRQSCQRNSGGMKVNGPRNIKFRFFGFFFN